MMDLTGMEKFIKREYYSPIIEIVEVNINCLLENSNLDIGKDDDNIDWDGPIIWG